MKIKLTEKDLKEYNEYENKNVQKVIDDMNEISLDDYFFNNNLAISDNVELSRFKNFDDYEITLNFNFDEMLLLSIVTELDNYCYDCKNFLWNKIVLDDDDAKTINTTTVETEELENIFYEIENQLHNQVFSKSELKKNPNMWINFDCLDNFKFKDLIDIDLLKEEIEYGLIELFEIFKNQISNYFTDDLTEFLYWNDYYNMEYIESEIKKNGYFEAYV